MAVSVTGSATNIQNNSTGDQSQAITIPVDAEMCILLVTLYPDSNNTTVAFQELNWNDDVGDVDFTEIGHGIWEPEPGGANRCGSGAYYMTDTDANWPGTGNKTLYWRSTSGISEGYNIVVFFLKGVDTSDPIGATETKDESLPGNSTYTTSLDPAPSADDMAIGVMYTYNKSPDADPSGYGQTSLNETTYNSAGNGCGYELNEDALRFENLSYATGVFFVVNASEGDGTIAIPVFLHHYKIAGGL